MSKPKPLRIGPKRAITRKQAIEQYVILRIRAEEIERLDYLLKALHDGSITPPNDSPFSSKDLTDTVRTCLFGWLASLTDGNDKALYPFDCLFELFPTRRAAIIRMQASLDACSDELQQFRSNVAFHANAKIAAHFQARIKLRGPDTQLDLQSAVSEFKRLMKTVTAEELKAISELPSILQEMHVDHHPAFARRPKQSIVTAS
jgi:hypothetical protein